MPQDRRRFLQHLTASGLALAAVPVTVAAQSAPDADAASENAVAARPEFAGLADSQEQPKIDFDVSWTQKLTGKYRAVFDTPSLNDGSGVWRAGTWATHYKDVLKAEPADINTVIVIRHAAIPLIMNHEFWSEYNIGKEEKVSHPMTGKKTKRNPVLMTVEDDQMPANFIAMTLPKQMERGVIVLGCNAAFGGMVAMVAKKEKLKAPEARTRALTMVVPGVILQPNGIFGVTMAQQHGCVFVAAA